MNINEVNEKGFVYYVLMREEFHRGPWSEEDVDQWLKEAIEDGFPEELFKKARQKVGKVEIVYE
jgi:hypothetical protein